MAKPVLRKPKKKVCQFCKEKVSYVDYKDTTLLRKFISDRGKIRARRVTGNCVSPRGVAIRWTKGGERTVDSIKAARSSREVRDLDHAQEIKAKLEGTTVNLPVRAGEGGRLFGAVTVSDIAGAIAEAGAPVD